MSWRKQLGVSITREGLSSRSFKRPVKGHGDIYGASLTVSWTHVKHVPSSLSPGNQSLGGAIICLTLTGGPVPPSNQAGLLLILAFLCYTLKPPRPGREEGTG